MIVRAHLTILIRDMKQLKDLYLKNKYLNIQTVINLDTAFNFIIGGRRVGKTFNSLKYCYENDIRFLFIRRTQKQIKMLSKPAFNPFKALNDKLCCNILMKSSDETTLIYEEIDGAIKTLGYACATSDMANMRGFDGTDIDIIIFDEFIPMANERVMKNEEVGFLDIYDTINSNRELDGNPPVKALLLANANELANPVFMELNLVRIAESMKAHDERYKVDNDRGYSIIFLDDSQIAEARRDTALYKLIGEASNYAKMALENDFNIQDKDIIKHRNIKEYKPLINIGELTIYKHKSRKEYYGTSFKSGAPTTLTADSKGREKFTKTYSFLWYAYIDSRFFFEDYLSLKLFDKYFNT